MNELLSSTKREIKPIKAVTDLKQMLRRSAEDYTDRIALRYKNKPLSEKPVTDITYTELYNKVNALGASLLKRGLKGKHVAIFSENRADWIIAYLAIISGAGVVIPVDRDLGADSVRYILSSGDAAAVFYSEERAGVIEAITLPALKQKICFDREEYEELLTESDTEEYLNASVDNEALAGIYYTSGTTGFSKGVCLSHKNIAAAINGATSIESFDEHNTLLSHLPYHHAFESSVGLWASLNYGATLCINDSIKYFARNMLFFKPDVLFSVPAVLYGMIRRVSELCKKKAAAGGGEPTIAEIREGFGGKLRRVYCGSAPLKAEIIQQFREWGVQLCQGYGLTETAPTVTTTQYDKLTDDNLNTVGFAIPQCDIKFVDGEIWVSGENVMLGYYKRPEETAEVIETDAETGRRWFKTGDLGYADADGLVYINGRLKNVIIASGGENVYPEEIEQLLSAVPEIADSMVYGASSGEKNSAGNATADVVTAVVHPNTGYPAIEGLPFAEVKEILERKIAAVNETLPYYKQIAVVKVRERPFEKTTINKVKRNEANKEI